VNSEFLFRQSILASATNGDPGLKFRTRTRRSLRQGNLCCLLCPSEDRIRCNACQTMACSVRRKPIEQNETPQAFRRNAKDRRAPLSEVLSKVNGTWCFCNNVKQHWLEILVSFKVILLQFRKPSWR